MTCWKNTQGDIVKPHTMRIVFISQNKLPSLMLGKGWGWVTIMFLKKNAFVCWWNTPICPIGHLSLSSPARGRIGRGGMRERMKRFFTSVRNYGKNICFPIKYYYIGNSFLTNKYHERVRENRIVIITPATNSNLRKVLIPTLLWRERYDFWELL
jgi:hypothetical protein